MGADLYIEPGASSWRAEHEPEFYAAVAARDTCADPEERARIQRERVTPAFDKLMGDSPYYYRDCYNPSSTLAHFGLSWWEDVIPMLVERDDSDDDAPNLPPDACLALADMIEGAEYVGGSATQEGAFVRVASAAVLAKEGPGTVVHEPAMGEREWYEADRRRLVDFLRRGADAGGIVASL